MSRARDWFRRRAMVLAFLVGACAEPVVQSDDSDSDHASVDDGIATSSGPATGSNPSLTMTLGDTADDGDGATGHSWPACGDGSVDPAEACDGDDLRGQTCRSIGFAGGTLGCTNMCTLDTAACTGTRPSCGDDIVDRGEDCDGPDLGAESCESLGFSGGGTLACATDCFFDTTGCVAWTGCGNGSCEPGENSCNCQVDCPSPCCGNGICDAQEECGCPEDCPATCGAPTCVELDIGSASPQTVNGTTVGEDNDFYIGCSDSFAGTHVLSFTAPSSGYYTIDVVGSAHNAALLILSDCSGTELACNNDYGAALCGGTPCPHVEIELAAGEPVLIVVGGLGLQTGDYVLDVAGPEECGNGACGPGEDPCSCPADCPGAGSCCGDGLCEVGEECVCASDCPVTCSGVACAEIDIGSAAPQTFYGTTAGEDTDFIVGCKTFPTAATDVLLFTAPAAGVYDINTVGSASATALLILEDCSGTEMACSSNAAVSLAEGQPILIVVDASASQYVLNIEPCGDSVCGPGEDSCSCPADCPDDPNRCSPCECGGPGGVAAACWCDEGCVSRGDCCINACTGCGHCFGVECGDGSGPLMPACSGSALGSPGTVGAAQCLGGPFVFNVYEIPVAAGDCVYMHADNVGSDGPTGSGGSAFLIRALDPNGVDWIELSGETPCSDPSPSAPNCPEGAVTVSTDGTMYIGVGASPSTDCSNLGDNSLLPYTLWVAINGTNVDLSNVPVNDVVCCRAAPGRDAPRGALLVMFCLAALTRRRSRPGWARARGRTRSPP